MNTYRKLTLLTLTVLSSLSAQLSTAFAQNTAFTYQGSLMQGGLPVTGTQDFEFRLFNAASGGAQQGATITVVDWGVTNGLFTVPLDFGAAAFPGSDRWLEISVRPGTNTGAYTALAPLHKITAAPYAIRAANLTGPLPLAQLPAGVVTNNGSGVLLAGAFTGNGAGLSNVNAATLGGLGSAGFWKTNGNAGADPANGAFLGTTDNLPVEFRVNGMRALRLEPTALPDFVNVVGGSPRNVVTNGAVGATVWGGGADEFGDYGNIVGADFGTVSGGRQNSANNAETTVAGGRANNASGLNSTVSGGYANTVSGAYGSIGGGIYNLLASADYATISGGYQNTIQSNAVRGTVGGGFVNTVGAPEGTVAGGAFNSALGFSSTIGGGGGNAVSGAWSLIAGGRDNVLTNSDYAAIGGGVQNSIRTNAPYSTIGGGLMNTVGAQEGTVAGGAFNSVLGFSATIGGGGGNTASGDWSTIAGGRDNQLASTLYATIGGGDQNVIQSNAANSTIGGGVQNTIASNAFNATIGGGAVNTAGASEGTVSGGAFNSALGFSSTIGGGGGNAASGDWSTIAGGRDNALNNAPYATIGGGIQNTIQSNGFGATIPGGGLNSATNFAFAAGYRAKADHTGAFVWADSTDADFASTRTNQFNIRASGGVRLETGGAGMTLDGLNVLSGIVPSASLAGTYGSAVTLNNAANSFSGNGANLTSLNASQLASGTVPAAALGNAWRIGGNASTTAGTHFLGTTDNQSLELKVNGSRALRLEPGAGGIPNIIAGAAVNSASPGVGGVTISGGGNNVAETNTGFATIGGGQFNAIRANGYESTIGGGYRNTIETFDSTIGGGAMNSIQTNSQYSTIAGGTANRILAGATLSAIGGGSGNLIESNAPYSTVPGGVLNTAGGQSSFAAGYRAKAMHRGGFVWADSQDADFTSTASNQFLIRATGGVGINKNNPATALDVNGTVTATSFTGNGAGLASLDAANLTGTVADARLSANVALRGGGNAFTGNQTIAGNVGIGTISPQTALHVYSASSPTTIRVQSSGGFGAGRVEFLSDPQGSGNEWRPAYIQSTDNGGFKGGLSFVVNGTGFGNFFTEIETMRIVNGRVGIGTNDPQSALQVIGEAKATIFTPTSDRHAKENFATVNPAEVLQKVVALPITEWSYKTLVGARHVGPMAQDFHAAFGLGSDDKGIATVDADGVALAAIQGLNQKVEEQSAALNAKDTRIAELEKRLAAIEALLQK